MNINKLILKAQPTFSIKAYYQRHSPLDLQLKDNDYMNATTYDSKSVVEWNIDGMSEYQIVKILKHVTMFATTYRNRGNTDDKIACAIVSHFVGQLQGWWDRYLTRENKNFVLNATRVESEEPKGMIQVWIRCSKYTDLYNFTVLLLYLVGSTGIQQDSSHKQLINLHCPTSHTSNGIQMSSYQKMTVRMISGKRSSFQAFPLCLLIRFAPSWDKHNDMIPYSQYNYGELIAKIIAEGLSLCIKLVFNRLIIHFSIRSQFVQQHQHKDMGPHKTNLEIGKLVPCLFTLRNFNKRS